MLGIPAGNVHGAVWGGAVTWLAVVIGSQIRFAIEGFDGQKWIGVVIGIATTVEPLEDAS